MRSSAPRRPTLRRFEGKLKASKSRRSDSSYYAAGLLRLVRRFERFGLVAGRLARVIAPVRSAAGADRLFVPAGR